MTPVENQQHKAHMIRMSLRSFFAMMIAFAMLFAPFAMQTGGAMAAIPSDHHAQMIEQGHCGGQPADGKTDKAGGKSCCVAMCVAIAVAPAVPSQPLAFAPTIARPTLVQSPLSYLAKLATPPPRSA